MKFCDSGRFQRCLKFVLNEEGGYSNDPLDHGGPTNWGISAPALHAAKELGIVARTVTSENMTKLQAENIYWGLYWIPSHAYEFPPPIDLLMFDGYVNHSPKMAIRLVQLALKVEDDGIVGPLTLAAAKAADLATIVDRYAWERTAFFQRIVANDPTQQRFIHGWLNRVASIKTAAMGDIPV